MMSIMRVVFKRGLRVSISASNQRQSNVKSASNQRQSNVKSASLPRQNDVPQPDQPSEKPLATLPKDAGTNLALFPDPDQKGFKTLKGEKDRRGSVRGNLQFGPVAKHVISEMNKIAGRRWTAKAWEPEIGKLIAKGFTQDDLITVVRWKAAESERTGNWEWFKPDTLFRSTLFPGKLDNAKAGVEINGAKGSSQKQSDHQDYTKGVDENGNW